MLTNAQIKEIKKLNEKSKARREAGLFVIEGPKMFVETPLEWIKEVYVTSEFLENADKGVLTDGNRGIRAAEMIQWMEHTVITREQMAKISDTQTPQGILCVVRQPVYTLEKMLSAPDESAASGEQAPSGKSAQSGRLYMVLEDIQDPGNLGTIFRTAEGAGVSGIILSRGCVDIFNPKTIRSTMGSIYRVPFSYVDDLGDAVSRLKETGISVYAAHLKGEKFYDEVEYSNAAFLIGNEGNGLKDETADMADCYIKIPMQGQLESLNAAVASAILMYEFGRQKRS